MTFFPENTRAQYVTRLLNQVSLEGDWEVGLYEILFSKTWYNLRSQEEIFLTFAKSVNDRTEVPRDIRFQLAVGQGNYTDALDIVSEINKKIENFATLVPAPLTPEDLDRGITQKPLSKVFWPKFLFNEHNNKIEIQIPGGIRLDMTKNLARMLGFGRANLPINTTDRSQVSLVEADLTSDLNDGLEQFYAYCDLIQNVKVGDIEAPLLRIVQSGAEKAGTLVHREYLNPIYIPLLKKNFEQIEIKLLTDNGKPVPFQRGRVTLTLHFRKSQNNYFV